MKNRISITILYLVAAPSAHSWLGCTSHDNNDVLEWVISNTTVFGKDHIVDPLTPWFADLCHGWPRAKQNPGDWVDESSNYIWHISKTLSSSPPDKHVCHPDQRSPTKYLTAPDPSLAHQSNPASMATASAGSSTKLIFGSSGDAGGVRLC
jgi:hypothetical protein